MMTRESWRVFEQFSQIARIPTWSGDLISKADTKRLKLAGLVRWKEAPVKHAGKDCFNMGGYVLTWRGRLLRWLWSRVAAGAEKGSRP